MVRYNVDIRKRERKRERKMFANLIVLNTVAELTEFLNKTTLDTLVNRVAFAGDLLARVNEHNQINIDEEIGFCDDGGWIEVDEMGYVVDDAWLP
jgi:hypothetical protein